MRGGELEAEAPRTLVREVEGSVPADRQVGVLSAASLRSERRGQRSERREDGETEGNPERLHARILDHFIAFSSAAPTSRAARRNSSVTWAVCTVKLGAMARHAASLVLTLLLLSSGAQAVVSAALVPGACDRGACCCADEEPAGPTLARKCCCAVERPLPPEPEPPPSFVESASTPAPDFGPELWAEPFDAPTPTPTVTLLWACPPRAPPVAAIRLYCVQRC